MIGIIIFAIVYIVCLVFPTKKMNFSINKSIIIAAGVIAVAIIAAACIINPCNPFHELATSIDHTLKN